MHHALALASAVFAGGLAAQQPSIRPILFEEHLPPYLGGQQESYDMELADFDGDGDLDCYVVNYFIYGYDQPDELLINDGAGRFRLHASTPPTGSAWRSQAAASGDLDGDGDVDLFGPQFALLNDGTGSFTVAPGVPATAGVQFLVDPELADVDGDGDLDGVAVSVGAVLIAINDGLAGFTTPAGLQFGSAVPGQLEVGDFDGDGDVDVFTDRLWRNDGSAIFTPATAGALVPNPEATIAEDFDLDGDLDLVSADFGGATLLANDGTGSFTDVTGSNLLHALDPRKWLAAGDVDGDGDVDLLSPLEQIVLTNNGAGTFSAGTAIPFGTVWPSLGDIDGDGDLDVVSAAACEWLGFCSGAQNQVWINDGSGGFVHGVVRRGGWGIQHQNLSVGDVDGDGLEDVYAAYLNFNTPLRNRGGRYEWSDWIGALDFSWFGDIDGDQVTDMLTTNPHGQPLFARVQTSIGFVTSWTGTSPAEESVVDGELADLDGDGDLDFLGTGDVATVLLQNDGTGVFTDVSASTIPGAAPANAIAIGNVLGGSAPTFFLARTGANQLFVDAGGGTFLDLSTALPTSSGDTVDVQIADFDGDGTDDVLFGDADGSITMLSSTGGAFVDASHLVDQVTASVHNLEVGDIDDDGDVDVMILDNAAAVTTLLNDGAGTLQVAAFPRFVEFASDLKLIDADLDGDLDVVYVLVVPSGGIGGAQSARTIELAINHHRQLLSPYVPSLGGPYTLRLYAEPGYAQTPALVGMFLGFATLPQPIDTEVGRWALAPLQTTVIPPITMPPSGELELSFELPNDPLLNGFEMHWQALFVHDTPAGARYALSDLVSDRLVGN